MTFDTIEYNLFSQARDITQKMINLIKEDRSEYVEVTRMMVERGNIYKELDSHIKTLDRNSEVDKGSIKEVYDELMKLDVEFRDLLKIQAERLRGKSRKATKDHKAHQSYHKSHKANGSLFISSKLEG